MDANPSLFGRDAELAALAGLIDAHRLVTITGVGGVGKTRLAMADAAEQLLSDAPGVAVLGTSREPLALPDEHVLRLDPLALAAGVDPTQAAASPAVQLFLARAAAAGSPVALDVWAGRAVAAHRRHQRAGPLSGRLADPGGDQPRQRGSSEAGPGRGAHRRLVFLPAGGAGALAALAARGRPVPDGCEGWPPSGVARPSAELA